MSVSTVVQVVYPSVLVIVVACGLALWRPRVALLTGLLWVFLFWFTGDVAIARFRQGRTGSVSNGVMADACTLVAASVVLLIARRALTKRDQGRNSRG